MRSYNCLQDCHNFPETLEPVKGSGCGNSRHGRPGDDRTGRPWGLDWIEQDVTLARLIISTSARGWRAPPGSARGVRLVGSLITLLRGGKFGDRGPAAALGAGDRPCAELGGAGFPDVVAGLADQDHAGSELAAR